MHVVVFGKENKFEQICMAWTLQSVVRCSVGLRVRNSDQSFLAQADALHPENPTSYTQRL